MTRTHKKNKRGFTMVELLLVVSIMSVVIVSVSIPMRSATRVWESGDRYADVMQNSIMGMDKITRELKHATKIITISSPTSTAGFIKIKDRLNETKKFSLSGGYLKYGTANPADDLGDNLKELSGPVNLLRFTCFQSDGSVPTTAPEKVAVIQIDMTTYDSQGKVPNIPLTSKVRVRMDKGDDIMDITDYCMYGKNGVSIKNNAKITSADPANYPANIGSLMDFSVIDELNRVEVQGNIVTGGSLSLYNNSLLAQDVYADKTVTIKNNAIVTGNVNCNGTVTNSGSISGYANLSPVGTINPSDFPRIVRGGVPPEKFFNPIPEPTSYSAGSSAPSPLPNLPPGDYSDLSLGNNDTLNLTSGVYRFNSFKYSNNANININLSSGSGKIQIFVVGDISRKASGSSANVTLTGGDASKVFIESHGNVSWTGNMYGTVFAPLGNIEFANFNMTGAIYSGGTLTLDHPNSDIVYKPPDVSVRPPQFP